MTESKYDPLYESVVAYTDTSQSVAEYFERFDMQVRANEIYFQPITHSFDIVGFADILPQLRYGHLNEGIKHVQLVEAQRRSELARNYDTKIINIFADLDDAASSDIQLSALEQAGPSADQKAMARLSEPEVMPLGKGTVLLLELRRGRNFTQFGSGIQVLFLFRENELVEVYPRLYWQ